MKLDGISPKDILQSLSIQENMKSVFKAGEGVG